MTSKHPFYTAFSFILASLFILLSYTNLSAQNTNIVTYVGKQNNTRLYKMHQLSDSTILIGGETEVLPEEQPFTWLPGYVSPRKLDTLGSGLNTRDFDQYGFIIRINADLDSIINFIHFPYDAVTNVFKIRTTNPPGQPTGKIYISGEAESAAKKYGYYIARLNNNFVNGVPDGLDWARHISSQNPASGKTGFDSHKSWHRFRQPWDVDNKGNVYYAHKEEFSFDSANVWMLNAQGKKDVVKHWPTHIVEGYYAKKDTSFNIPVLDPAFSRDSIMAKVDTSSPDVDSPRVVIPLEIKKYKYSTISMKVSGTGMRGFRSRTKQAWEDTLTDENGFDRIGSMPNDFLFTGPCDTSLSLAGNFGTCDPSTGGPKGYRALHGVLHSARVGDIVVDKRNGHLYLAYTFGVNPPSFSAGPSDRPYSGFDYESHVVALSDTGTVKWWARLHKTDTSGSASVATQFVDNMAIDYSSNNYLVVQGRTYDTCSFNLWNGDEIKLSQSDGFQNQFTGSNIIEHSWLGQYGLNDGKIYNSTYVGEYGPEGNPQGTVMKDSLMDGWQDPNTGNPDLASTYITSITINDSGKVIVLGTGSDPMNLSKQGTNRTITTANAYQKMYKPDKQKPEDSVASANSFVRIYNKDLSSISYSSLLSGQWAPVKEGRHATNLMEVLPYQNGLIISGYQENDNNVLPLHNIPSWGSDSTFENNRGIFANISFDCPVPAEPGKIMQSDSIICNDSILTFNIDPVKGSDSYKWMLPDTSWSGDSDSASITVKAGSNTGIIKVKAKNQCGPGLPRAKIARIKQIPSRPVINGPVKPCKNTENQYFTEQANNSNEYKWSLPDEWTGNSKSDSILVSTVDSDGVIEVKSKNHCGTSLTGSLMVEIKGPPQINGITQPDTHFVDQMATYKGEISEYDSLKWELSNSDWSGSSDSSTIELLATSNDGGTLKLTAYNNCDSVSKSIELFAVTGINNKQLDKKVELYPNPASKKLDITFKGVSGKKAILYIYTSDGKIINHDGKRSVFTKKTQVDISELPEGYYFLKIKVDNKQTFRKFYKK